MIRALRAFSAALPLVIPAAQAAAQDVAVEVAELEAIAQSRVCQGNQMPIYAEIEHMRSPPSAGSSV